MIHNVQLLRVLAALAVVYYHVASEAGLNLPLAFGTFGVDIFFVVSGFIIAYIGTKSPHAFFVRRLIRIVPFYWSASLFVFSIALFLPRLLRQTTADLPHLCYSLFFIPHDAPPAGMFPTLILGWTLNYEMYFYVLFAVALLFSRRYAPLICTASLTLIVVAITLSGTESEAVRFYASPIVFEFAFGIGVFYVVAICDRGADELRGASWLKWLLYGATLAAAVLIVIQGIFAGFGLPRVISSGLPALVIVLGAILIEKLYQTRIDNKPIFILGEASYILYLIHPYMIYGVLRLIIGRDVKLGLFSIGLLLPTLLVLPSVIAVVIHLWIEKPVMTILRRVLIREPVPARIPASIPAIQPLRSH
jgi:exopolysaccharide production protein ExoZ